MVKRPFQIPSLIAHLLVPVLLGLAAAWLHLMPPVKADAVARLRTDLPETLNGYTSLIVLHCQNTQCLRSFTTRSMDDMQLCPSCGGSLLPISFAEHHSLPADTVISRRIYSSFGNPTYTVTVVLAGADPRSIHRPQQCLPAQGFTIDRQTIKTLPLSAGRNLDIMLIDTRKGADSSTRFGFVYWFVGPTRETPSHLVRAFWTLYDSLLRNTASRWAYVTVIAGEPLETPESLMRLSSFLSVLVPAIETAPPGVP